MKYYLFKWNTNYADEMSLESMTIMSDTEKKLTYDKIMENTEWLEDDYCAGVGSNEEIEYEHLSDFMNEITVTEITKQEYETILFRFGYYFGSDNIRSRFEDIIECYADVE